MSKPFGAESELSMCGVGGLAGGQARE